MTHRRVKIKFRRMTRISFRTFRNYTCTIVHKRGISKMEMDFVQPNMSDQDLCFAFAISASAITLLNEKDVWWKIHIFMIGSFIQIYGLCCEMISTIPFVGVYVCVCVWVSLAWTSMKWFFNFSERLNMIDSYLRRCW